MKTTTLNLRPFLIAFALALVTMLMGCQAVQPTKTDNGGQTATPAGKAVLNAADAGETTLQSLATLPGLIGVGGGIAAILGAIGVKYLHTKLDDLTPETPVIATVPAAKS